MPFLLLKLLGIGKWLREAAGGVFSLVRRYPLAAALIASLCLAGWFWHGKSKAIEQRDAAVAGRKADRTAAPGSTMIGTSHPNCAATARRNSSANAAASPSARNTRLPLAM